MPAIAKRAKASRKRLIDLTCVVCRKPYQRPKNIAVKAKVCTKTGSPHKARFARQPDGSTRRIPCGCCLCLYKKTLAKNRSLDGKIIPSARIDDFLKRTRSIYGENIYLAFRLGLNAMLRVQEISALKIASIRGDAKPLPQVDVLALKKKVELKYAVDVDPRMAADIGKLVDGRPTSESLFGMPVRTLQHKFKQIVRGMDLGHLSIHSLRHTGISNRARAIANMNDLNYLRQQARHESIETTKLYMGYEERQRVEMAKIVKWF